MWGTYPLPPISYWLRAVFPSTLALVTQGRAASQVPEKGPREASRWAEGEALAPAQPKAITCVGSGVRACFYRVMMFTICFL